MQGERSAGLTGTHVQRLTVATETAGTVAVLSLAGELDLATVSELDRALEAVEHAAPSAVLLDLREVTFIDSYGLRSLVAAANRSGERGLYIACGPGSVRRLFELTAVTTRFSVHESRDGALAAIGAS